MFFWIIPLFFFCYLLPYAIPAAMPSWRALAVCILLIGGGLAYLWYNEWLVEQDPDYHQGGVGGAIGISMFMTFTGAFVAGATIRAISLALRRWSATGAVIVNAVGFVVLIGVFLAPIISWAWVMRPVSAECAAARFAVEIAGAHLQVPASPLLTIRILRDSYDLSHPPSLRDFCGRTDSGARSVKATMMDLRFEVVLGSRFADMSCADAATVLGSNSCTAFGLIQHGHVRNTDYPSIAHLFAPNDINMRGYSVTASTADDAANKTVGPTEPFAFSEFFSSKQLAPDGKPLTFACRPTSMPIGNEYYCHASYAWHGGAHLDYGFNVPLDHVVDKGERVDATVRAIVDAMLQAN